MAKFVSSLKAKLIYVFRINDKSHAGCLKVGEATLTDEENLWGLSPSSHLLNIAAKKRINQYTQTAGITYDLLYTELSIFTRGGTIMSLTDGEVHKVLERSGIKKKVFDIENADLKAPVEALGGKSLGETLLTPTKIYVKPILALLEQVKVKGISHITGGGFYENIPRSIPDGLGAKVNKSAVKILPIFTLLQETGNIPERDMFNTFNMGVGMSVVVKKEDSQKAIEILKANGEDAYIIGEIIKSDEKIIIVD